MSKKSKKIIKINFRNFPKGFDSKNNFFTYLLKKEYNVVLSDSPDYVFFSVYGKEERKHIGKIGEKIRKISPLLYRFFRKTYAKIFPIKIPKLKEKEKTVKIFFSLEYVKPDMSQCDWAFSYPYEDEMNSPRYMKISEYLLHGYKNKKKLIKDKNYAKRIMKQKTKFCNFIYFNDIKYREVLFKKISKYKKVDSPGYCMNNMPYVEGKDWKGIVYEKWMAAKLKFIKPYKFTIVSEYRILSGYTDEKIYHAMVTGSIPIYLGNPLVHREFNTKSFINCSEFENLDKVVEKIKEIDSDDKLYEKMLNEPWFYNNRLSKYMNEKRILKRLKDIFG